VSQPSVPARLSEVTPAWLTAVLRECGAIGSESVESADLEPIGMFSNEVWRVRLTYDRPADAAPATLALKRPGRTRGWRDRGFDEEIGFYRALATEAPARVPRCYFGARDPASSRVLLLLEDVELEAIDFRKGATEEHTQSALEELAELHAHWWQRVEHADFAPHFGNPQVLAEQGREFDRAWRTHRDVILELSHADMAEIGDALVGRVPQSLAPLGRVPTLLHGDAHFENLPLVREPDGGRRSLLLDWASVQRGNAGFDVSVFASMSFRVEDRRRLERELVASHADQVRARGIDWPDPWLDYRRGSLARAVEITSLADRLPPDTHQARAALVMVLERTFSAAVDQRCGELIAV